jgi:hypothetical protein
VTSSSPREAPSDRFHPIAGLFPLKQGANFDARAADIRINWLREPITKFEGLILGGRNGHAGWERMAVVAPGGERAGPPCPSGRRLDGLVAT